MIGKVSQKQGNCDVSKAYDTRSNTSCAILLDDV